MRLILAGVFDRFPGLQVVVGRWGEVVLFYAERLASLSKAVKLQRAMPTTCAPMSTSRQAACSVRAT